MMISMGVNLMVSNEADEKGEQCCCLSDDQGGWNLKMKTGRKRWARWIVNHDQFALPDLKTMVVGCPSFSIFVLLSFWWYFGSKRCKSGL
jgi:hypothetical protein